MPEAAVLSQEYCGRFVLSQEYYPAGVLSQEHPVVFVISVIFVVFVRVAFFLISRR